MTGMEGWQSKYPPSFHPFRDAESYIPYQNRAFVSSAEFRFSGILDIPIAKLHTQLESA
jgi:spore maturation protein SpmB